MTWKLEQPARPHNRKCAARIRTRRLLEAGDPQDPPTPLRHGIAQQIHGCCGASLLKAHRLAYDWTVDEAVAAFHAMCQANGLKARGLTGRSWTEWEAGANPNADYQDLLCRLFATGPVQLGLATDYSDRVGPLSAGPEAERGPEGPAREEEATNRRDALKRIGSAAAIPAVVSGALAEGAAEALGFRAQTSAVGPGALEHLELVVARFSQTYARTPPAALLPAVRWYRGEVDRMIAGPHTLREGR
ncbi:MAG: hypothetical protein ACRD0K_26090 [Egibacteraceae bacterium]